MSKTVLSSALDREAKAKIQIAAARLDEVLVALDCIDEYVATAHVQAAIDALELSLCRRHHDND